VDIEGDNTMKGRWLFLVGLALLAGLAAVKTPEPEQGDGIFIHVSHGVDDPHRVAMALRMAEIMEGQRDVLVYFDLRGIDVCLKSTPDIQLARMPSSKAQVQKLLDRKVTIMACPACLQAAGKTPEDLVEGVQIADKDRFFTFTKGRILSIDY
jgi:predicted peroxiredoxin